MTATKIGVQVPADLDRTAPPVYAGYCLDSGMEYELFECDDGVGALVGVSHEDVGLVTWWRVDSLDEGWDWIDARLGADVDTDGERT